MAKAISENNSRQLWTEVRKIRNRNSLSINCIDDITGNSCIAELFSKKYDELYNSVSYEEQEMNDLMSVNKKDVEIFCVNSIDDTLYKHTHKISLAEVQAAVQKLKVEKSDCVDGFVSDNLKKDTECLYKIIALLFSTMLTHGVAPAGLLLSTLVPIPKNKRGNKSDSNNIHADRAVECVAIAIRELCDMRDSDDTRVFSGRELKFMIDMLCTM